MEVTPEMYAWLTSQNVINPFKSFQTDINTSSSFQIPKQTLELLLGGKYIDNILKSLQDSYNKLYDMKLDYTDNLNDLVEIKEDDQYISNSAKYTNWHLYQESLKHFGLIYPDDLINQVINGDKEILLQILTDIFELQNEVIKHTQSGNKNFDPNKFINEGNLTFKNTVTENKNELKIKDNTTTNIISEEKSKLNKTNSTNNSQTNETFQNQIKGQSESININKLDPNKKYENCTSPLEFFIISLCKNLKLKPRQSVALLSNNRKYLSILCNKGTQGNYDQINNWINDLETNLKSLTRLLKLFSDGVSIGYAIIGTALCSKDYNVVKKCCELLNKILSDVGINWDWLIKEGFDSFIYAIIKHEKLRLDLLTLLYQFIKGKNKDFFKALKKKFDDGDKKKIYEFFSAILPELKNINENFTNQFQKFLFGICLNEKDDMSISLSVLGDAFYYFYPIEEDLINQILDYFNLCVENNSENIFTSSVTQIFNLMEKFGEIKNQYAPPLYKNITYSLISNYDNEIKREFILLNFEKFFNSHQTVPIDILLEPYIKHISSSKNYSVCDFLFLFKIVEHPRMNGMILKSIIRFLLKVTLNNLFYSRSANLVLGLIFDKKIIMRQCNNNEIGEISKIFSDYIIAALKLFISNLKNIEDTAILETPYDILNENFPNVNNNTHNNIIDAVKLYRKEKKKNSQGLLALLWCFNDHDEILLNLEEENRPIYDPVEIYMKKEAARQEREDNKNFNKKNQKLLSRITDQRKEKEKIEKTKSLNQKSKENILQKNLDKKRKRDSLMVGLDEEEQGLFNENNLITGDKNSNLTYALTQAAKNYKRKGLTITEYDTSKDDLINKYKKILADEKEMENLKNVKIYEKIKAIRQLIYPEGTIIKDSRLKRSKSTYVKVDHDNFPIPIELNDEEGRELKAIEGYNLQYKKNLKFYFRTYANERTDTISKSNLLRMYRDRGYKKNQISLEELNLTIRNLFNDNLNDLTFDQFKDIIVQLSFLIYQKIRQSLSLSECYELFLNRLCLITESDISINLYEKFKPAIELINEKKELKEKFNYPPGFKSIKKERVSLKTELPENIINTIGENKYVCFSVLNDILYNVFNSPIIEPFVSIENKEKIELDPLKMHKWSVDLTCAYINLERDIKDYGIVCADILEEGLQKICYRRDNKGNLIVHPITAKENETRNKLLKEEMKKDEERVKRKNEIESVVKEYENLKKEKRKEEKEKAKKKRERELKKQEAIEKKFEENENARPDKEKKKKKKIREEKKKEREERKKQREEYEQEIEKIKQRADKLKGRIERYHKKKLEKQQLEEKTKEEEREKEREEIQAKYAKMITNHGGKGLTGFVKKDIDKDLNKNIQNLMEKEDIKKVINDYYSHLQFVYNTYVLLGFSKLEQTKGMRKNEFREFLVNFSVLGLLVTVSQMNWIYVKITSEKLDKRNGESYFDFDDFILSIGYLSIFARFTQRSRQLIQKDIDETTGGTIENFMKFLQFKLPFNQNELENFINDRRGMTVKNILNDRKELKYDKVTQDLITNNVKKNEEDENKNEQDNNAYQDKPEENEN